MNILNTGIIGKLLVYMRHKLVIYLDFEMFSMISIESDPKRSKRSMDDRHHHEQ